MITRQGDRILVDGPVTLDNVEALLAQSVAMDGGAVVIDLAGVTTADSSALSLLLEWTRRARDGSGQVAFANPGRNLRSLAELYGIIDLIPLTP